MTSIIDIEIGTSQERAAALLADPAINSRWMEDLEVVAPIAGELGAVGSKYRMVQKEHGREFVATVVAKDLPRVLHLELDAPDVWVSITDRLEPVSARRTRLVSMEIFDFKGLLQRALGLFARHRIKEAHRRHMEAFKRFAEGDAAARRK